MSYQVSYTGPEIDAALQKALLVDTRANGWTKIDSTKENPISLDTLTSPGNYTIDYWTNGPTMDPKNAGPLNLCITSSTTTVEQCVYHLKNSYVRSYTLSTKTWGDWGKQERDTEYSIQATAPTNPGENAIWVDITTPEKPEIKIFLNGAWHGMNPGHLMDEAVYDPTGQKTDVFAYVDTAITNANLGTIETDFKTHIEDRDIHVTLQEKTDWNAKPTPEQFATKIAEVQSDMEAKVLSKATEMQTQVGGMTTAVDGYVAKLNDHTSDITIHASVSEKADWNSKATGDHTHLSDGRVEIDASNIVSGTVSVDRIDRAALERVVTVATDADRMALTKDDVQDGDLVYVRGLNPWASVNLSSALKRYKDRMYADILNGKLLTYVGYIEAGGSTNLIESFYGGGTDWWDSTTIGTPSGIDNDSILTGFWIVNNLCILSVYQTTAGAQLYWSTDGKHYTKCTISGIDAALLKNIYIEGGITSNGSGYVAITRNIQSTPPTDGVVLTSTDGKTWTAVRIDASAFGAPRFRSILYFKDSYYLFGSYRRALDSRLVLMLMKSADGTTWTKDDTVNPELFDIAPSTYNTELESSLIADSKIVVTGYYGGFRDGQYMLKDPKLFTIESADGVVWTRTNSPQLDLMKQPDYKTDRPHAPFIYVNGRYYTTSYRKTISDLSSSRSAIISSDNRIDWTYDSPTVHGAYGGDVRYTQFLTLGVELAATYFTLNNPAIDCLDTNNTAAFYYVIHDDLLGTENAFQRFSTGGSAVADWNNIVNKPTTLEQYGITDAYTSSEIDRKIEDVSASGDELLRDAMIVKPVASATYDTLETQLQTLTADLTNTQSLANSLENTSAELESYAKKIYTLATS